MGSTSTNFLTTCLQFNIPNVLSIGLGKSLLVQDVGSLIASITGGGSVIHRSGDGKVVGIGPSSVGYKITTEVAVQLMHVSASDLTTSLQIGHDLWWQDPDCN